MLAGWQRLRPACERLARRPVLFRLGPSLWVTYGALVAVGAVVASAVETALLAGALPARAIDEYLIGLAVAMPAGGRLLWLAYNTGSLRRAPATTMRRVGFVSFGSYLAMFAGSAAWWALR